MAHKKGISSHQLAKDIKVTQKSAWFILQRIRESYKPDNSPFDSNEFEVDETYVGGLEKNKHQSKKTANTQGRSTKTKTVFWYPITDTKSKNILPVMRAKINPMKYVQGSLFPVTIEDKIYPDLKSYIIEYYEPKCSEQGIRGNHHHALSDLLVIIDSVTGNKFRWLCDICMNARYNPTCKSI